MGGLAGLGTAGILGAAGVPSVQKLVGKLFTPNTATYSGDTLAVFCAESGGTCAVTEAYDQTGNGNNITQATAAVQPGLTLSCLSSLPCLSFGGTTTPQRLAATFSVLAQPFTIAAVAERTGQTTSTQVVAGLGNCAVPCTLGVNQTNAGAITATANDNAWHVLQGIYNGASPASILNVDNTQTTGTNSSNGGTTIGWGRSRHKSEFAIGW